MSTRFRLLGQGISALTQGATEWRAHFFPLTDDDIEEFARYPSARFIVRERSLDEIDHDDFLDANRPGARALVTVYRSGHRDSYWDAPGWFALNRYIVEAERALDTVSV